MTQGSTDLPARRFPSRHQLRAQTHEQVLSQTRETTLDQSGDNSLDWVSVNQGQTQNHLQTQAQDLDQAVDQPILEETGPAQSGTSADQAVASLPQNADETIPAQAWSKQGQAQGQAPMQSQGELAPANSAAVVAAVPAATGATELTSGTEPAPASVSTPAPTSAPTAELVPQTSDASTSTLSTPASPTRPRPRLTFGTILANITSGFGEVLITIGLVLGLFAAWQVFVTDSQVTGTRDAKIATFEKSLGNAPKQVSHTELTTPPPAVTHVGEGQTFAVMYVPRWNYMTIPILEGTSHDVLDLGNAGHYRTTAWPGEVGNFAVAAHRRTYGSSFRLVHELKNGDPIIIQTPKAWLVYQVYTHEIVLPQQGEVILPVPMQPKVKPVDRLLTMTTCDPEYGNSHRYIVHSKFSHWVPRDTGIPKELAKAGI